MRKEVFHNVLVVGAVAGALSFAIPSSAAILDSEAAQIDTIDVSSDIFVKLKEVPCPGGVTGGFFHVPANSTTAQKLSAILTAAERLYIVAFRYDTANCSVSRVFVCPRTTGRCDA